jgi:ribosomal protein S27E
MDTVAALGTGIIIITPVGGRAKAEKKIFHEHRMRIIFLHLRKCSNNYV